MIDASLAAASRDPTAADNAAPARVSIQPAPTPVAPVVAVGQAAPPVRVVTDTFTSPKQEEPVAVTLAPEVETVTLILTWKNARNKFDAADIRDVQNGQVIARGPAGVIKLKPRKLKITRKRTATSLRLRLNNVSAGPLRFKVTAKKVSAPAKVTTQVVKNPRR